MSKNKIVLGLLVIFLLIIPDAIYAQDTEEPFTIGILAFNAPGFIAEMTRLGYVEGENINYLYMTYEGVDFTNPEEIMNYVAVQTQTIIDANPDILISETDSTAVALREQAGDIPIVFSISDDPIATGAVTDLTTPGGTMTGVISNRHHERRLQLLTEVNPETERVYYLYSSMTLEGDVILNRVQALGEELGIEVIGAPIIDVESSLQALENMPEDVDWIFLTPYVPLFDLQFTAALVAASQSHQTPIAGFWAAPMPDYLVNYGPDLNVTIAQAAQVTDLILRGANPSEVPVVIAENGLVINLEAAETFGIEIPEGILRQADFIVRPGYFDNIEMPGN